MGNGEFRPPGEPKLLNRLRWNLAWVITSVTPPHMHKTKSVHKGGSFKGGGEMFTPSVLFFSLTNNVFCARQQQCWCMSLLYKLSSLIFTLWYGIKMSEEQFLKMAIVTKMWTVDYDWQLVLSRIFRSYGTQKTLANTSVSLLQSIILYKSGTWTIKEQKWKLKAFEKKSAELQEAIVDVMWIYWRSFRWKRISIKY